VRSTILDNLLGIACGHADGTSGNNLKQNVTLMTLVDIVLKTPLPPMLTRWANCKEKSPPGGLNDSQDSDDDNAPANDRPGPSAKRAKPIGCHV
jgi:hypothetical protein